MPASWAAETAAAAAAGARAAAELQRRWTKRLWEENQQQLTAEHLDQPYQLPPCVPRARQQTAAGGGGPAPAPTPTDSGEAAAAPTPTGGSGTAAAPTATAAAAAAALSPAARALAAAPTTTAAAAAAAAPEPRPASPPHLTNYDSEEEEEAGEEGSDEEGGEEDEEELAARRLKLAVRAVQHSAISTPLVAHGYTEAELRSQGMTEQEWQQAKLLFERQQNLADASESAQRAQRADTQPVKQHFLRSIALLRHYRQAWSAASANMSEGWQVAAISEVGARCIVTAFGTSPVPGLFFSL